MIVSPRRLILAITLATCDQDKTTTFMSHYTLYKDKNLGKFFYSHIVYMRIKNYLHIHYMRIKKYPHIHYMRIKLTFIYTSYIQYIATIASYLQNIQHSFFDS